MSTTPILTTSNGNPVDDNQNSLTAGPNGPVLLQDFHLIDKLGRTLSFQKPSSLIFLTFFTFFTFFPSL